ncbi:hypothetical protein GPALN_012471 [Globodera pallida]|nr:hypothetical protein GPALN_012471 [Globodera pallida]
MFSSHGRPSGAFHSLAHSFGQSVRPTFCGFLGPCSKEFILFTLSNKTKQKKTKNSILRSTTPKDHSLTFPHFLSELCPIPLPVLVRGGNVSPPIRTAPPQKAFAD